MKRAKRAESAPNARSASRNHPEQKQIHNSAPEVAGGEASVDDERETLSKIHKLEKSITEKSQITNLSELISVCQDTQVTPTVTFNTVRALQRVFMQLADKGVLNLGASEEEHVSGNKAAKHHTNGTVMVQFKAFMQALLDLLTHRHDQVKTLALKVLMELLHKKTTSYNTAQKDNSYPSSYIDSIVEAIVTESRSKETALFALWTSKYLAKYADVRYNTLKSLRVLCDHRRSALQANPTGNVVSAELVTAIYMLLQKINMPTADKDITSFWIAPNENAVSLPGNNGSSSKKRIKNDPFAREELGRKKKRAQKELRDKKRTGGLAVKFVAGHKKAFEECYIAFLQLPLTTPIYKDVLRRMDTHILPHMVVPIRLIDFLKDSYDVGGVVSILALHGLFILITKHNLDYPDFYKKLYSLFQPNIFHVKYRAKFFKLANIFLKSSHLPAYLVAAFVKRMARLALQAPPSGALFVIAFAYNMLKRHPQCQVMLHYSDSTTRASSLLPAVDERMPTGVPKNKDAPVLMLAPETVPSATMQPLPASDSVLMLNGDNANSDDQRKRKRDEMSANEAKAMDATITNDNSEESSQNDDGQHKKRRRRRGRGGDGHQDDNEQQKEEDSKNKERQHPVTGPLEENDVELGKYLHAGSVGSDPFVFEELDPQKCHALNSSLWELKALQHHYVPQVSKLAKIFDEAPVKQPFDLDDFIDQSYQSLFEAHTKRKTKSTALAYQPQETLFSVSDCFQSVWLFPSASV